MDRKPKHLDADDHAPEIRRQEADVEERGGGEAEHDRCEGVEERQAERVAGQVPADFAVPVRVADRVAVENGGLRPVDYHREEGEEADHFVDGPFADEVFLRDVGEAVE